MAGFVAHFQVDTSPHERDSDFQSLLATTARFKGLELPDEEAVGRGCTAGKLNAPSSLHHGVTRDVQSGSWLLAAGTVVALEGNNDPNALLDKLLEEYLEQGSDALDGYDGHFGLIIYNDREGSLSIISDPTGFFSIFYAHQGNKTYISTSALAVARLILSQPDTLMMDGFLRSGIMLGDHTLWQDVKRVLPATIIKINGNKINKYEYWNPSIDESITKLSIQDALEYAIDILYDNFRKILIREGNVWADLTGGFDTRLTTMVMAKLEIPFATYCAGPAEHPDVKISKYVSREMGWKNLNTRLPEDWSQTQFEWLEKATHTGDGSINIFSLAPVLYGHQERATIHRVNVTGLGGDEWREATLNLSLLLFNWRKTFAYDLLIDNILSTTFPQSIMCLNREGPVRNEWRDYLAKIADQYANFPNAIKGNVMFIRYRYPSHGGAYTSASAGIVRSISPFCFKELVNYGTSLDYRWRISYHQRFVRSLLEKVNPQLANIETTKGGPAIPIRLTNLHRFIPLWDSLTDKLVGKASSKLLGKRLSFHAPPDYPHYPLPTWKTAWLRWAVDEHLLSPERMHSGALYNSPALNELVAQDLAGNQKTGELLERVITLEMAMRATGAMVE